MALAFERTNMKAGTREELFLGVYRSVEQHVERFQSCVGKGRDMVDAANSDRRLVGAHRVPPHWHEDMQWLIARNSARDSQYPSIFWIGDIDIRFSVESMGTLAITSNYYPKDNIAGAGVLSHKTRRAAPGLGYATEFIVLSNLGRHVTHIRSTSSASMSRRQQLDAVGLPVAQKVPMREWTEALLRGYAKSVRKARRCTV